jgi:hypothetical protein
MIMDCVIRYKNMILIAKMKFEEFTLNLVHTDLRSQTTTVPPIKYSRSVPGFMHVCICMVAWAIRRYDHGVNAWRERLGKREKKSINKSREREKEEREREKIRNNWEIFIL